MMRHDYDDLLEQLPDDPETIEQAEATLVFIGQAWINDYAREVDDSRAEFTVPLADLRNEGEWAIHSTATNHHVSDGLRTHGNAPEWVQEWQGPFELKLKTWDT